eukprot:15483393-Alexandrium_andersonii.AAC.1
MSCRSCPSSATPLLQQIHQSIGIGLLASTTPDLITSTRTGIRGSWSAEFSRALARSCRRRLLVA